MSVFRHSALFPGSNSAAAVAEETLAGQYRVPAVFFSAADISVTTTNFNRFAFQLSSSTYMDPRAVAQYVAQHGYKRIFTIAPDNTQIHLGNGHLPWDYQLTAGLQLTEAQIAYNQKMGRYAP